MTNQFVTNQFEAEIDRQLDRSRSTKMKTARQARKMPRSRLPPRCFRYGCYQMPTTPCAPRRPGRIDSLDADPPVDHRTHGRGQADDLASAVATYGATLTGLPA